MTSIRVVACAPHLLGQPDAPTDGRVPRTFGRASAYGYFMTTDAVSEQILRTYDTITVVGASANPAKAANEVPAFMQARGWRIIPVNPTATEIVGERVYPTLADIPEQLGVVNVFRPSADCPEIARQAVAAGASALWLQLGIASDEAREIAESAGLLYVEDRCLMIEVARTGISRVH